MGRHLAGLAVLALLVGGAAGCSRGNEMETVYNDCIDNFSQSVPEQANDADLGTAQDYLSYDNDTITVVTPTDLDSKAAAIGANTAALCVMQGLKAPADATTQAATGAAPGKASWGDGYSATWETQGPDKVGLKATKD